MLRLHLHLHLDRGRQRAWFDCRTDVQPSPAIHRHLTGNRIEMRAGLVIRTTCSLAVTMTSHSVSPDTIPNLPSETAHTVTAMVAKTSPHKQVHPVAAEPFTTCPAHGHQGLGTTPQTPTTPTTNPTTITNMITTQPSPEHSPTPTAPALQGSTSQDPHASSRIPTNPTISTSIPKTPKPCVTTSSWSATTVSSVRSAFN